MRANIDCSKFEDFRFAIPAVSDFKVEARTDIEMLETGRAHEVESRVGAPQFADRRE